MSDNLSDRLQRTFDRARAASEQRGFIYGTVGRQNENGSYSVVVAGRPNYLYVTVDGEQASTIARGGATPRVAGLPVRMKREQGELVIVDVNQLALGAFLSGGAGGYNVAFHHHNEGSGLEYAINSSRLKPGRVRFVEALTVHIGEFAYSHLGDWRWWPGGNIDLTSVKPATAGEWAWVLVGVDPSTNAAVAVAGASQATGTPLTVDQIESIAFNGYIPCGAVRVRADDTALNLASRYADARIWLDRLGASGGGDVAAEIDGATEKVTPDGTDKFGLVEGGLLKWLSWTNLAAGVQAALDALYFRLTGRAGGQVAVGGTASGDTLTLRGSVHATSGGVAIPDRLRVVDDAADDVITGGGQVALKRAGTSPFLSFHNEDGTRVAFIQALHNAGFRVRAEQNVPLELYTNDLERMTIIGAGNVGVNQPSPGAQVHVVSGSVNRAALRLETATTPNAPVMEIYHNGALAMDFFQNGSRQEMFRTLPFDNGSGPGGRFSVARNNNGSTPAAGHLALTSRAAGLFRIWPDASGNLRIWNGGDPTFANDGLGVVVGTQTSAAAAKDIDSELPDWRESINHIIEAVQGGALRSWKYKSGAYNNEHYPIGIVTDYAERYGQDKNRSLNIPVAIGDLMGAVVTLAERVAELEAKLDDG